MGAQQKGPHFVSYDGFSLDAGLSTRFAARNLGEGWLVLQMSLISAEFARSNCSSKEWRSD